MSIIIVGSGIVGATLGLAISHLTNGKLPINIIEINDLSKLKYTSLDNRAIALSKGTCQLLEKIDIWKAISDCTIPIKNIYVSEYGSYNSINIKAKDYCVDTLGQIVKIHDIKVRLFQLLQKASGITLYYPEKITHISRDESTITITLSSGDILKSQLLIAADGSYSTTASKCGIKWKQKLYNQFAITTNVVTTLDHNKCAWEKFTEYGSLAMLPVSYKRCFLVWCHALNSEKEVLSWSNERFCIELQKVFGWGLGYITDISKRDTYPLSLITATQFISHRVVLVGNAAQTLHPIAGQGLNLGLRDVLSLSEILVKAWHSKQDYGNYSILSYYRSRRQLDKLVTIKMTDSLVKIFTNRRRLMFILRSLGFLACKIFTPLRDTIMCRALGWVTFY